MSRPIVILDTIGEAHKRFHPRYRELFPGIKYHNFRSDLTSKNEPHGGQVAFCYMSQLSKLDHDDKAISRDIHFIKALNDGYDFTKKRNWWWMDAIRELKSPLINMSLGMHHDNNPKWIQWFYRDPSFRNFVEAFSQMLEDCNGELFAASGNEDSSIPGGYVDLDDDVNFPQRLMAKNPRVHIIGACDIDGHPAGFSSDGDVQCMYWGSRVPVIHPFTGIEQLISGTSFASPFAMGDSDAKFNLSEDIKSKDYNDIISSLAIRAKGWPTGIRHPKAGDGGMLPSMRSNFLTSSVDLMSRPKSVMSKSLSWFDAKNLGILRCLDRG